MLDAHPAIGQRTGSPRDRPPSRVPTHDPAVLTELAVLNAVYEERPGFRFVVFVNRRPKAEILEVLRDADRRPTDAELETAARRARRDRRGSLAASDSIDPYLSDWLDLLPAVAPRDRRRSPGSARPSTSSCSTSRSAAAEGPGGRGGGVAGELWERARRRLLPRRRSTVSRRACCPSSCTGSSGRRTRPGSRASRCMVVLYYLDADVTPDRPAGGRPRATGRRSRSRVGWLALAWVVYDVLCRALGGGALLRWPCIASRSPRSPPGARASSSRRAPRGSRSGRCSERSWPRTSSS